MGNTTELSPCNYCKGGELAIALVGVAHGCRAVTCDCGAQGKWCDTREEAITAWNARSHTYALGEAVERLRELKVPEGLRMLANVCAAKGLRGDTTAQDVLVHFIDGSITPAEIMAAIDEVEL